jgi:DMSO/TMAO reductase YedYZ molybdopterin-dependent catalytic subunit
VAAGRVIPVEDLYVQSYQRTFEPVPRDAWQLRLGGQMRRPLTLNWADVQSLPLVEQMHTLECIGNPVGGYLIGNLVWQGVRLRDVLALAEPTLLSDHLRMTGADQYVTTVPLELARDERSLVAFSAGGQPLPDVHGYPARVLLPGVYGQKQPKWVIALEAVTGAHPGTWEREGWSDTALIQVNSRIDYPRDGSWIPPGQALPISGVAFADTSGIAQVEVSVDDGAQWSEAELFPGPSTLTWTAWQWEWATPTAGPQVIKARATSGAGQTQIDAGGLLSGVFPNGTSSIHSIAVTVG